MHTQMEKSIECFKNNNHTHLWMLKENDLFMFSCFKVTVVGGGAVERGQFGHMLITPGGFPLERTSFLLHSSDHIISHQPSHHQHVCAYICGCLNTVSVFFCVHV